MTSSRSLPLIAVGVTLLLWASAFVAIRDLADLRRLGLQTRATGFLTLRGRALEHHRWTEQLGLWQAADDVGVRHQVYDVSPGTFR